MTGDINHAKYFIFWILGKKNKENPRNFFSLHFLSHKKILLKQN